MDTVSDYFGCTHPEKIYGTKAKSRLLVGIEIELENALLVKELEDWTILRDGSLKEEGLEFTLPVWEKSAIDYLNHLFNCLKDPHPSSRCSVHIHADVTKFTLDQIKSLIALYTIFEKPLYKYSGNRWDNIYCVPVQTWAIGLSITQLGFKDLCYMFKKYSGLHLFPEKGKLGTAEFRHMVGNTDPQYIFSWISIITDLVTYAQKQSYAELLERISDMRATSQYRELFLEIFDQNAHLLQYPRLNKDIEEGITFTKLIAG